VQVSITEAEAKELALSRERIKAYLGGKEAARIIYVPLRLVNIVLG
jgi:leucyl-tRNA synthetase